MNDIDLSIDNVASDVVKATLSKGRDMLIREAQGKLKTSRSAYVEGISGVIMDTTLSGRIILTGHFPTMIEEGFNSFDQKKGFKKSQKVTKTGFGGWYLTIPFRHRRSGISNVLPGDISKYATNLKHKETLKRSIVRDLGYKPQTSWAGYTWKSSKYDGLQRLVKTYASGKKHSQYITFRRVSNNSDSKSFMHPGYKGLKAFDRVAPQLEEFAYDYWENSL